MQKRVYKDQKKFESQERCKPCELLLEERRRIYGEYYRQRAEAERKNLPNPPLPKYDDPLYCPRHRRHLKYRGEVQYPNVRPSVKR